MGDVHVTVDATAIYFERALPPIGDCTKHANLNTTEFLCWSGGLGGDSRAQGLVRLFLAGVLMEMTFVAEDRVPPCGRFT